MPGPFCLERKHLSAVDGGSSGFAIRRYRCGTAPDSHRLPPLRATHPGGWRTITGYSLVAGTIAQKARECHRQYARTLSGWRGHDPPSTADMGGCGSEAGSQLAVADTETEPRLDLRNRFGPCRTSTAIQGARRPIRRLNTELYAA